MANPKSNKSREDRLEALNTAHKADLAINKNQLMHECDETAYFVALHWNNWVPPPTV